MRGYINLMLQGNVGKVRVTKFADGNAVANFSLAVNQDYKDKKTGKYVEKVNWVNCVVRNPKIVAAVFEPGYVKVGTGLNIHGATLETRTYEVDGVKRYVTEAIIGYGAQLHIAEQPNHDAAEPEQAPVEAEKPPVDADIPF